MFFFLIKGYVVHAMSSHHAKTIAKSICPIVSIILFLAEPPAAQEYEGKLAAL